MGEVGLFDEWEGVAVGGHVAQGGRGERAGRGVRVGEQGLKVVDEVGVACVSGGLDGGVEVVLVLGGGEHG